MQGSSSCSRGRSTARTAAQANTPAPMRLQDASTASWAQPTPRRVHPSAVTALKACLLVVLGWWCASSAHQGGTPSLTSKSAVANVTLANTMAQSNRPSVVTATLGIMRATGTRPSALRANLGNTRGQRAPKGAWNVR